MTDPDPLDSTPRDGGGDQPEPGMGEQHDPTVDTTGARNGPHGGQPAPDTGTPQDDLDDLDGWHTFAAAVDTGDGSERTIVMLRCSDLAHADRQTLEQLGRLRPWPSIESCGTCTPRVPEVVPSWLTE